MYIKKTKSRLNGNLNVFNEVFSVTELKEKLHESLVFLFYWYLHNAILQASKSFSWTRIDQNLTRVKKKV